MNITDELERLHQLHQAGAISDAEFVRAKARLLNEARSSSGGWQSPFCDSDSATMDQKIRQWALFLHLSQFAGYLVPLAGLILPIVLWQIKKAELPEIDAHGKVVANWILSEILYAVVFGLLSLVLIGIPFLIALGIMGIIFPIIGAVKANTGEVWRYPLSIPFFQ